ncbi:MAG: FecR family protein [Gammaproteobacteria bacterium]|nr:FecR family protein [Gammaproteobacteria bacterium]
MSGSISLKTILFVLMSLAMWLPGQVFAAAGTVLLVLGDVERITEAGKKVSVRKGDAVEGGDIIVSGPGGQVMILMQDETRLSIRPNSRFVISQYRYLGNVTEDKSEYDLIKGGFRAITGKMGKRDKGSFKAKTPAGDIGVNGTDFSASYCTDVCSDKPGLYLMVRSGGIDLKNRAGQTRVIRGQIGFASSGKVAMQMVDRLHPALAASENMRDLNSMDSEEEIIAIAMRSGAGNAIADLLAAGISSEKLIRGAVMAGISPVAVLEPMLDLATDKTALLEATVKLVPDRAGDILMMSVATNRVSPQDAQKAASKAGVDAEVSRNAVALGKMLAPPPEKEEGKPSKEKTPDARPASTPKPPVELIPQGGTGGGEPASPS